MGRRKIGEMKRRNENIRLNFSDVDYTRILPERFTIIEFEN